MRSIVSGVLVLLWCFIQQPVSGGVVFNFIYTDIGTGFNAPGATGQTRRDALELAAQSFGTSALANYNATIEMTASGTAPPLAAAGSEAFGNPTGGGFGRTQVVRNKILTNGATDLNGGTRDGFVEWNFASTTWELDINAPVGGGEFGFYSTVYHELTHALGWSHSIDDLTTATSGEDPFGDGTTVGDGGTGVAGEWNKFDEFISDSVGNFIINGGTFLNNSTATWDTLQIAGASPANGLFFDGPNATAANGGNPVGLFTPNPIQAGSSISHLDDQNPAQSRLMMLSAAPPGLSARTFSAIELGILSDLGYTNIQQIQPIPEPSALMCVGVVGLLGYGWKRSRT